MLFVRSWIVAMLLTFVVVPVWGAGTNLSGVKEYWFLGTRVRLEINHKGKNLNGVVKIYRFFGKKDTYHFNGKVENRRVVASHSSGHVFRGHVTPDGRLVGTLTTKTGLRVPIDESFR